MTLLGNDIVPLAHVIKFTLLHRVVKNGD